MAVNLAFDTSFLIDLQKERRDPGAAHRFLAAHADDFFHWSAVAVGEFVEGFASQDDPILRRYLSFGTILPVDLETALAYGVITRKLRAAGQLIGANDLWIASSAVRQGFPLVTSNAAHFRRVPGLEVVTY